jgi:hypothetical protein
MPEHTTTFGACQMAAIGARSWPVQAAAASVLIGMSCLLLLSSGDLLERHGNVAAHELTSA